MKTSFMNEEVIFLKSDGSFRIKLFAVLSRFTIIAEDAGVKIEPGDLILRTKRDGKVETYLVLSSDFKIPPGRAAIYQLKVRMLDEMYSGSMTV